MTVRVKVRVDGKAMIRFGDQLEEQWFTNMMRSIRDSDPKMHPEISLKNKDGDIPKLPKPIPQKIEGKSEMPKKLSPEIIKKMKIQEKKK